MSQMKEAFLLFDKDHDGFITISEIMTLFGKFGNVTAPTTNDDELKHILKNLNRNNKNISFDEFLQMMTANSSQNEIDEELMEAFKVFDRDGNGKISVSEMKDALKVLEETLSDSDISNILAHMDTNNDGSVSYEGESCYLYSVYK